MLKPDETADPKVAEQPFVANGYMEKLLDLAEREPKKFATLSPATRLSVGYYAAAKRRAAALQSPSSAASGSQAA